MKVQNINGTSDNECKCGSWKAHWEKYNENGDEWPMLCSEVGCIESATEGAHVQKEDEKDKNWYIIPLCKTHNGLHGKELEVVASTSFAPANCSETCGK